MLLGAERRDVRRAEAIVGGNREAHRRIHPGQLLDADAVIDRRHRRAAVLLGKLDPHQPQRREARKELGRKVLRVVPLAHVGTDLAFREFADAAAKQLLVVTEAEVHLGTVAPSHYRTMIVSFGMRLIRVLGATLLLALISSPAFADATLFLGSTTTPTNRPAKGFAVGVGLLVVGFEFEFAETSENLVELAPRLRTGMGNVMVQTPIAVAGMQFYLTTGGGAYRETLADRQETHVGVNTGGGVKVSLLGPIKARLDYRVFKLRGEPLYKTVHRVYAGLNLAF